MSGIYGFLQKCPDAGEKCLHALDVWNRYYGHEREDAFLAGTMGAGCHQEHLSDRFPGSAPVIWRGERIAVIDAILYNREELLNYLNEENPAISDEELLLNWIDSQGYAALAQVNGDFAGAVYDAAQKTWTLFRDHSGVRPLFYYMDEKTFAFSTDLRGLAALPGADLKVNEEKLYLRMMGYNDLSLCETEYEKIRCIHPASWTVVGETDTGFAYTEHIYWKWGQKKIRLKSDGEYQKELRRLITDAVRRRLDATPGIVGCELSGGLDSSVIAILISQLGREGRFFSWSFSTEDIPMKARDERKIIQDICSQEHISCHYAKINKDQSVNALFEHIDPPYLNTRYISEGSQYLRSQNARVVFTGHGGDEGVSHRCNFYELWYHHEYFAFLRNIYRGTRGKKLRLLRTAKAALHQIFVKNPYFRRPFHKYYANASRFVNPAFAKRMENVVQYKSLPFAYDPIAYILQGGHRVRLDNVAVQGAESGMRYMVPFVDFRVLDFALSIPRAQFHNGYTNRYIYRQAFDDMIPQSLRDMHYKDTPSQQDYTPDLDLYAYFQETKQQLMDHFDREFWKDYLDLDAVEAFSLPENFTRDDFIRTSSILNEITRCCAIQHVAQNAGRWSEEHE